MVPHHSQDVKLPDTLLRSNSSQQRGSTDVQCLTRELIVNNLMSVCLMSSELIILVTKALHLNLD